MALIHSFESSGNYLFKRRGWLPVILFILVIPVLYFTSYPASWQQFYTRGGIGLSILGFIIRAYAIGTTPRGTSGRNTKEQVAEELNQTGIYSMVRHPLYLGNYFMWIGIVFFTGSIWFTLIVSLLFWIYYERIMFAEERFLERKFGDVYTNWSLKTPAFIPAFHQFRPSAIPFSFKSVLRREYAGILNTVLGFLYIEGWRHFIGSGRFNLNDGSWWILGSTVLLTFFLRSLKHYTGVLTESGRS